MILGAWNIRGLNHPAKQWEARSFISQHRLGFCALLETRVQLNRSQEIARNIMHRWSWSMNYEYSSQGRIWFGFDPGIVSVSVLDGSDQFLHLLCTRIVDRKEFFVSCIYASYDESDQSQLWHRLLSLVPSINLSPWVLMGDFNVCKHQLESRGGNLARSVGMTRFADFLNRASLQDLSFSGPLLTWSNRRAGSDSIFRKLDRVLVNDGWLAHFDYSSASFLLPGISDHSPMIVSLQNNQDRRGGPFRFNNHLVDHPSFAQTVQSGWALEVDGWPMFRLVSKLKAVKQGMKLLNSQQGHVTSRVLGLRDKLHEIQGLLISSPSDASLRARECALAHSYQEALSQESDFFRLRARIRWSGEGDRCSRFFFQQMLSNRNLLHIHSLIRPDGSYTTSESEVPQVLLSHFSDLLGSHARETHVSNESLDMYVDRAISSEVWPDLLKDVSSEEIRSTLFSMGDDKAPGPDGFTVKFFRHAWDIVGADFIAAVSIFFIQLVDVSQTAFVPGRSIGDNILMAQELLHRYHIPKGPDRCALKIKACVTTARFSVKVNGRLHGFFPGGRGLRQGDPLSPYLFVLVMQVLHGIVAYHSHADDFRFHWKCDRLDIAMLSFADDLMLFSNGDQDSVRILKQCLDRFADMSGLAANPTKSFCFVCCGDPDLSAALVRESGFRKGSLPICYLGIPLISKQLTYNDCRPILDRVRSKVVSWRGRLLSFAGRLQLVQSVLSTIHVYWASIFVLPKKVLKEVERVSCAFLWDGPELSPFKAKVAWADICFPKDQGGLGLRPLYTWNQALAAKLIWRLMQASSESLWIRWIHSYRIRDSCFWLLTPPYSCPWYWRRVLNLRVAVRPLLRWKIGNGHRVFLWHDQWHPFGVLVEFFSRSVPRRAGLPSTARVSSVISQGGWSWPHVALSREAQLILEASPCLPRSPGPDLPWWVPAPDGCFSARSAMDALRCRRARVPWGRLVWHSSGVPSYAFILWCAMERHSHLFFSCVYSRQVLQQLRCHVKFAWPWRSWERGVSWAALRWRGRSPWVVAHRLTLQAAVYLIWRERNHRCFRDSEWPSAQLAYQIQQAVWVRSLKQAYGTLPNSLCSFNAGSYIMNYKFSSQGRIWIGFDPSVVSVSVLGGFDQFLHLLCTRLVDRKECFVSCIYPSYDKPNQSRLWHRLLSLVPGINLSPWVLIRDFNVCKHQRACSDSIFRKLDCVLVNDGWLAHFDYSSASFLLPGISDHSPMTIIQSGWALEVDGWPMFCLVSKLKAVKHGIKLLNSQQGHVTSWVLGLRDKLYEVQGILISSPSNASLRAHECALALSYLEALSQESDFFRLRARIH
ncbi:uncharacterized protein LOC127788729 [Diospyros lotus]|uniref:uncharacterized protein LOC127788729 n=1 Tax=Diospyros lotus TaxID=55363 RepID=UPI00224EF8C4|nr:uncharacterized protein LOC127788729 [Diospyros lotus]